VRLTKSSLKITNNLQIERVDKRCCHYNPDINTVFSSFIHYLPHTKVLCTILTTNETYFNREYAQSEVVKAHVTYKQANIFDEDFKTLGKFDYIFSRNMLIYFNEKERYRAKEILENLLKNSSQTIYFGHADFF